MGQQTLKLVLGLLPLAFAFGFLAPVIMAMMNAMGWGAPLGLTVFNFSLLAAGIWGLIATLGGRWI